MQPHRATLVAAAMLGVAPIAAHGQSAVPTSWDWAVEAAASAIAVPGEGSGNITIGGTTPVVGLRLSGAISARWSLSVNGAYGEAREARRDVYERPSGPTRTDTYDYRVMFLVAGAEYTRPLSRVEIIAGVDAGWAWEGWRVASHVDPAGMEPPQSNFDGSVAAGARIGLRYPLTRRIAVSGQARYLGGPGVATLAPELGLRWTF